MRALTVRIAPVLLVLAIVGCSDDSSSPAPSEKPEAPAKKPSKPSYVKAFERQVREDELLHVRSLGYEVSGPGDVEVRCFPTKVRRGGKLLAGCETHAYASRTGDIIDAEELPERDYEIQYDPQDPSDFHVSPP